MDKYNHREIEKKWQRIWEENQAFVARDNDPRPKFYGLIEFPYPSGEGLHVGHPRSYTAMDIIARKRRMEGYNVLYPIGFDSFGLPTENYAIKTGRPPAEITKENIANFTRQLKMMGFSFDWSRAVTTSDPSYYKWTQWIFLQLFKHGLAYKKKMAINWCPSCKIGLANEEVVAHSTSSGQAGACERCGTAVEKREKEQWMLAITKYADKLLEGLKEVDYIDRAKVQQENWIGRSEGALLQFSIVPWSRERELASKGERSLSAATPIASIEVFTTRPDTLFGATYLVLAPEHEIIENVKLKIKNWDEVEKYIDTVKNKTEQERTAEGKDPSTGLRAGKTGVELKGVKAINPATKEEISIWVADYVLAGYGTGAIMAVPAHDERDFEFAKKYDLPVREVVRPGGNVAATFRACPEPVEGSPQWRSKDRRYTELEGEGVHTGSGILINSGTFNGLDNETAKAKITEAVGGVKKVQYKLRDWVFSRQRYWGEPIPLVFCENCKKQEESRNPKPVCRQAGSEIRNFGWIPLPEDQLPLELPKVEKYQPTDTGESPLAAMTEWVNTKCPRCGSPARRETDTMPNWAGSSWYFLRYCDPRNDKEFASMEKLKYWMGAPTPPNLPSERGGNGGAADQPKYFIFDFDGVIGDTFEAGLTARVTMGHSPDLEAARKSTMEYATKKPGHARNNGVVTKEELEQWLDWGKRFGPAMARESFGLFDEFIKEVERVPNARIAIVSNGSEIYVRPAMERSKLKTTHILNAEDHPSKVEKIRRVCKDWGVGVKDIYYFTDTKSDIFELENFVDRSKIIGCAWGYLGKDELESVLPREQILENYADIHKLYRRAMSDGSPILPVGRQVPFGDDKIVGEIAASPATAPRNDESVGGVNWYNGGMEHTVLHLLYSRFWNQFLYDIGVVPTREPYKKRTSHGMILAEDGEKMSKSRGNVINPNEIVEKYGADVLRVYEMFMGPFDQAVPWSTKSIAGVERFLERVWQLGSKSSEVSKSSESSNIERLVHKTVKKVTEDIEEMKFNTAIAAMMSLVNELSKQDYILPSTYYILLQLLNPFAPHVTEELWEKFSKSSETSKSSESSKKLLAQQPWPQYDPALIKEETIELVVQVNGKVRDRIAAAADILEDEAKALAMGSEKVKKWLGGQKVKEVVFVKGKLINIVTS